MKKTAIAAILGVLLIAGLSARAAQAPDPAKVAAGKATFEDTKCWKCHGQGGRGDRNHNNVLLGLSAKLSAAEIRQWIESPKEMTAKLKKQPKEPMKKFDLTPEQIDGLVAYVQSLKK